MGSLGGITGYDDPELEDLIDKEDIVILQPKDGWIVPDPLPSEWSWNGKTLHLTRDAFTSSSKLLRTFDFPAVTFVGCPSLDEESVRDFADAVEDVCGSCITVTVVHNKDFVTSLLRTFQCVQELMLPHNMRLQNLPEILPSYHPVRVIKGDMCGIGVNHLLLDELNVLNLATMCPKLKHLDVNLDEVLDVSPFTFFVSAKQSPVLRLPLSNCILGSFRHRSTLDTIAVNSHVDCKTLQRVSSSKNHPSRLQIVAGSDEVVAMIPYSFEDVTHLFVKFINGMCSFKLCFPAALKSFQLSVLELRNFGDVKLSEIAEHSSSLQSLSLIDCSIVDEKLKKGAFRNLRVLRVGIEILVTPLRQFGLSQTMFSRLIVRCSSLNELQVSGLSLCSVFLKRSFQKSHLVNLKKLVLWTNKSFVELGVDVADLVALKADLVSLKCVVTDSFDIRLFFEVYAQDVKLKWLSCTQCAGEFAAVNGSTLVGSNFFADVS